MAKTIAIFEAVEVSEVKSGTRPVQPRGARDQAIQIVETSIDVLSENMANFIEGVSNMLSAGAKAAGVFQMDTVEVQCQLSGGGKIGFIGTGVDLKGSSTLKIVFKKKE